jgi:hypothetical protein
MKRKREQANAPGAKFQIGSIVEIAGKWKVVGIRKSGTTFIYEIENADSPTTTVWFFESRLE